MALPLSGNISLSQINTELGVASNTTRSLGAVTTRTLFNVASGAIRLAADGYGKSNVAVTTYTYPLSHTSTDPTSVNWTKPAGYSFTPNVGITTTAPITGAGFMFRDNTTFNDPDISTWDTSTFLYTSYMFQGATAFNQPLNNWDVSNVRGMYAMFYGATAFNQPLNNWNVSKVGQMDIMFYGATAFNQNISSWNVGRFPTSPQQIFTNCPITSGNQPVWSITPAAYTPSGTITYVGSASGVNSATLPAHQAGDIIFAWCYNDNSTTFITTPSGWNSGSGQTGTSKSSRLGFKIATSSSETTGTWTNATSATFVIYRGNFDYALFDTASYSLSRATGTTVSYSAMNSWASPTTIAWTIAFVAHSSIDTALETPPANLVLRHSYLNSSNEVAIFDSNGTKGAWPTSNVSVGGTSAEYHALVLRLPLNLTKT